MISERAPASDYMRFAKLETEARYNLAGSGLANLTLADIGADLGSLALHGDNPYGWPPLRERIADRFGVTAECVVTAAGASFANHLALAALLAPGDEVVIEHPTYPLLTDALAYFHARVVGFPRGPAQTWRLEPAAVAERFTARTRLVVLANPHNPSGAMASDEIVREIAERAAKVGAMVLVDEVYRELEFPPGGAVSVFDPKRNLVVTSSLTKAYGLSGLRCGWILAPPAVAERMRRLDDLFAARGPHMMEQLALAAFDRLDALRERARAIVAANRAAYREIFADHPRLAQIIFDQGTTVFPRLLGEDAACFAERLRREHEVSLVPGRFFGAPEHLRIGLGADPAPTREGLGRIAEALEQA